MPMFKWAGRGEEWVDARVASMLDAIAYPEARGKPKVYPDVKDDSPVMAKAKEAKRAEYRAFREKELRGDLMKHDAVGVFGPDGPLQVVCKKGEKVFVHPKNPALKRLKVLAESDGAEGWQLLDEPDPAPKPKAKPKPEEPEEPNEPPKADDKPPKEPPKGDAPGRLGKGK